MKQDILLGRLTDFIFALLLFWFGNLVKLSTSPSCYIIGTDAHAQNIHVALYGRMKLKFHNADR